MQDYLHFWIGLGLSIMLLTSTAKTQSLTINTPNLSPINCSSMAISNNDQQRLLQQLEKVNRVFFMYQEYKAILPKTLSIPILAYNKKYQTLCQQYGWAIPASCSKVLGENYPSLSTKEEDIELTSFVSAVTKWHMATKVFFKESRMAYSKVIIDSKQFKAELEAHQSPLPIVANLYREWQNVLSNLEDSITGEQLFEQFLNHSGEVWKMTNNLNDLEEHYKKYRKLYKKLGSSTGEFKNIEMPQEQYFLEAIQGSSSKEDPNLPENLEAVTQRREKLKDIYRDWLNKTLDKLSNIDSTEQGKVINKRALSNKRAAELFAPAHAKDFWEATGKAIEQKILSEQGAVSYENATKLAIVILDKQYTKYVTNDFLQGAADSGSSAMPLGLEDWLRASVDDNEVLYEQFSRQWQIWCREVANMVALCEQGRKGKTYPVNLNKLNQGLKRAFDYTVNSTVPGMEIWQQIKVALPLEGASTITFEELDSSWKNGIEHLQQEAFIRNLWSNHLTSGTENKHLELALSNFFAKLPSKASLINALLDARQNAPKRPQLQQQGSKDTISASLLVQWRPVPVLMGTAAGQVIEELGLDSLAALLRRAVGGQGTIEATGVEDVVVRLAEGLALEVIVPMQVVPSQRGGEVIVVPSSLEPDSIKFTGTMDAYYQVEVLRVYTDNKEPEPLGEGRYQQRLWIATQVTDPSITVGISASAVVGAAVNMGKHPKKYSMDIELLIESSYNKATNTFTTQFSRTNRDVEDHGNIVESMQITTTNRLTTTVYKK